MLMGLGQTTTANDTYTAGLSLWTQPTVALQLLGPALSMPTDPTALGILTVPAVAIVAAILLLKGKK